MKISSNREICANFLKQNLYCCEDYFLFILLKSIIHTQYVSAARRGQSHMASLIGFWDPIYGGHIKKLQNFNKYYVHIYFKLSFPIFFL